MKHSASPRLAGCDKNAEVEKGLRPLEESNFREIFFSPSRKGRKDLDARTHPLITRCQPMPTPWKVFAKPLRPLRLCEKRATSARYFSRQAAKVAKEKHEYFAAALHGFPRLLPA